LEVPGKPCILFRFAGGSKSGFAGGNASGFHLLQRLQSLALDAVQPLLVQAEVDESVGTALKDGRSGERGVDLRTRSFDVRFGAVATERKQAVFERANTVRSPLIVDDGQSALFLGECFGGEFGEKFSGEVEP
jgi:hypothetical protein